MSTRNQIYLTNLNQCFFWVCTPLISQLNFNLLTSTVGSASGTILKLKTDLNHLKANGWQAACSEFLN